MRVTLHLCMPAGETMRQQWTRMANAVREDNRYVIASKLAAGEPVPDRIEDWGVVYGPERHRRGTNGDPELDMYGLRGILTRGRYSCADACALESAVLNEKYGVWAHCLSVAQGDDDYHGIYVSPWGAMDPVARVLGLGTGGPAVDYSLFDAEVEPTSCQIVDGHVVCAPPEDECSMDERGLWHCPIVPGLHGRREKIGPIAANRHGARWSRTAHGAAVPVRRRTR